MKIRSRKRSALLAFSLILIGLGLLYVVWVRNTQRQYALNRQLIEALQKSRKMNICKILIMLLFISLSCSLFAQSEQQRFVTKRPAPKSKVTTLTRRSLSLSNAAMLAYGERQIARMLKDRPTMRRYITADDSIHNYVVRMFGGERGVRFAWNSEPAHGSDADSQIPTYDQAGYIRVTRTYSKGKRKGQDRNGEELWECAIFEMNNMHSTQAFNKIYDEMYAGKINKKKFIENMTRVEYTTARRTLQFYLTLWKPSMKAKRIHSDPLLWWTDLPPTFAEWMTWYTDHNDYPWVPYSKDFDAIVPTASKSTNPHTVNKSSGA